MATTPISPQTAATVPGASAAAVPITGTATAQRGAKVRLQTAYQALVSGISANYQPTDTFAFKQGTYTRDELSAQLNKVIASAESTKAAREAWLTAVKDEQTTEVSIRPLRSGMHGILRARFGNDAPKLAQFGFQPTKPSKKTLATKVTAAAKTKATRTARSTAGKKQKASVKGTPQMVATALASTLPDVMVAARAAANSGGAPAVATPATPAAAPAASTTPAAAPGAPAAHS